MCLLTNIECVRWVTAAQSTIEKKHERVSMILLKIVLLKIFMLYLLNYYKCLPSEQKGVTRHTYLVLLHSRSHR